MRGLPEERTTVAGHRSAPGGTGVAHRSASALGWLRSATRAPHARAEAHLDTAAGQLDGTSYAGLLLTLFPVYRDIEHLLGSFDEWSALDPPLDIASRRRSQLIVADLRTLGIDERRQDTAVVAPPRLELFSEALGALYVVEGSRLGGRVLATRIGRRDGSIDVSAFRFLRSARFDVGGSWGQVLMALDRYAVDTPTRAAVVAGAIETFSCFELQLERWAS